MNNMRELRTSTKYAKLYHLSINKYNNNKLISHLITFIILDLLDPDHKMKNRITQKSPKKNIKIN